MNNQSRRHILIKNLPEKSLILLTSGREIVLYDNMVSPFVVNRNFFYLTNIRQESSFLLIVKDQGINECLFITDFDEKKEMWNGKRLTLDEAKKLSGINDVRFMNTFKNDLKLILQKVNYVYLDFKMDNTFFNEFKTTFPKVQINNIYPIIASLRAIKDSEEIDYMKKAISITNLGLKRIIKESKIANNEMEIYNAFNHEVLNHGTHELGFTSIIASGENACCLHYATPSDQKINRNDLILCDVGAAYQLYSADVTRTYPLSGKFSPLQKTIYQIVLETNKKIIDSIRPNVKYEDLQALAIKTLADGCLKNGLIKEIGEINKYYYHGISHQVGLDVHDPIGREVPLKVGHIITVEPGLYFKEKKIGIRIEDDVLVTEHGHEVLTKDIKKEIDDIEKLFLGGILNEKVCSSN